MENKQPNQMNNDSKPGSADRNNKDVEPIKRPESGKQQKKPSQPTEDQIACKTPCYMHSH